MFGFIVRFGIKAAVKKYGKAAIMRIAKNHGLIKKSAEKVIPKKVGLTAKEMAKRDLMLEKKKAAIALKKFQAKHGITKTSTKKTPNPRGKPTGSVVRNYRGKPEPTYSTSKKYKPYVPPKKP